MRPFSNNNVLGGEVMAAIPNKKKRKRELLSTVKNPLKIKIAFLTGGSPGEIPEYLEIFLLERGIMPEIYIGGYNRYYEDAVYGINPFAPDIIYFHTTYHDIKSQPEITDSPETVTGKLDEEFERLKTMWGTARARFSCAIVQNNFGYPPERTLGNLDCSDYRGITGFLSALNLKISKYARETPGFYVQDIAYLSAREGLNEWNNAVYMHMYKYTVSLKCMPALAGNLADITAAIYGRRKKCLVLDLDNTLWGGIVGETGVSGLKIGQGDPEGEAFLAFQKYLLRLKQTGILLAATSKNEESVAISGFDADGMLLKRDDFAAFIANWEPKHENIVKIAETLNIGLDSIVFVDDNPAERELIKKLLPEVAVIDASEPIRFLRELDQSGFFEPASLSKDDVSRAETYRANTSRTAYKAEFDDYYEYLKSLSMECFFMPIDEGNAARVASLINKTNQFNMTGLKLTEAEAAAMSGDYITVCARLEDKFGDNGLVSVFIGKAENGACSVLQWVMSCRVFGRKLEYAVFDEVVRLCRANGTKLIKGVYMPTRKNTPVASLYEILGFRRGSAGENGESVWEYEIPEEYESKNDVIDIKHQY